MVDVLKKGDSLLLRTEKISSDGSGIARLPDGLVVFVPGALPGESLRTRITTLKKEYAIAAPEEIVESHPKRTRPACPVYDFCGGCQLQHAEYALQLELKQSIVHDAFTRILKRPFPSVPPCIPSPDQMAYRNKTSLPVRSSDGKPGMGYFARRSHAIVPMKSCPVAAGRIDEAFSIVMDALPSLALPPYDERGGKGLLRHAIFRQSIEKADTLVSLVVAGPLSARQRNLLKTRLLPSLQTAFPGLRGLTLNLNATAGNVIVGPNTELLWGDGLLEEELSPFAFEYDSTAFFQINSRQAHALYQYTENIARFSGDESVLELFSGIGSLTAFLTQSSRRVTAVEEWESAVRLMKSNMARNGIENKATVIAGAVENIVPALEERFDVVVLDPPRTGCHPSVLHKVLSLNPQKIVYVSCNPATLARDAAILFDGGFDIEGITCFDMFPQTVHVETVVRLSRRG